MEIYSDEWLENYYQTRKKAETRAEKQKIGLMGWKKRIEGMSKKEISEMMSYNRRKGTKKFQAEQKKIELERKLGLRD